MRYTRLWRNKFLTVDAKNLHNMVVILESAASELDEMFQTGAVTLQEDGVEDDYATLVTNDPEIAKKFGFDEEEEFDDEGDA